MSDVNAPDHGAGPQGAAPTAPTAEPIATDAAPAAPPAEAVAPVADPGPADPSAAPTPVGPEPPQQESGRPSDAELLPPDDPARRRDKTIGTVIVVVAFLLSLAISLWAKHHSRPEVSEPPKPATPEGVVGFPSAVDALATLPAARLLTKRPMLRGIIAEGVRANGTIDAQQSGSRVRYTFQSPPGHGPQPPREPGTLPRQHYCGKQTVQIKKNGIAADPDRAEAPCVASQGEPLPDPQCNLRDLWEAAKKRGFPSERLARIEYYRSKAGPAWRFELPGSGKFRFSLHGDCQRELVGTDAQNL